MWWRDAVIYQLYLRSFQDSDGDGVGDLPGAISRLDHVAQLGAKAVWLSPLYPSPNADFGYDIADYIAVDPAYGTLADLDALIASAHDRGMKVLLDFVPCHTSILHPWFRDRPEFYFWADAPANNWRATFGGSAWQLDSQTGRYYLHSFFPEQADLDWRNPDVREAMAQVMTFWLERKIDGFRIDAIDRLVKDPELREDPTQPAPSSLPQHAEYAQLRHLHSHWLPDLEAALVTIRQAAGDAFLVGEVFLPTSDLGPYLEALDVAFAFEPMNAGPDAGRLRATITAAYENGKLGWVISNHDFSRFASRLGDNARAAALLFFSLPGPLFLLQGDELGMIDGPGSEPPLDRAGRDPHRHPMQWNASPSGGFTTGEPWLPSIDPAQHNVQAQVGDPDSTLSLYRRLTELRPNLGDRLVFLDSPADTLLLDRGDHVVAVNLGTKPAPISHLGELVLEARPGDGADPTVLPGHGGWIARKPAIPDEA